MQVTLLGKVVLAFFAGVFVAYMIYGLIHDNGYGAISGWDIMMPGIAKSFGAK